ncbi:hypothetical protein L6452_17526 [Arctium lappa]|uniref:Uncharacterized protein n=1 Tax=Arctium lappa TaxID=4217 RepID=A0ACB9C3I3_ARCLA|nr:hypothetical protein L6452_17526 [Arctium lappa]
MASGSTFSGDETAPFFGFLGAVAALVFSCMGAAYGTAKSGMGVASIGVMRPELVMKSIVPVVMAGVLGIYGLIIVVIISIGINPKVMSYYLFDGYAHLSSGLACGLAGLSAGMAIDIVGDAGVRANAQQPKLFVGMILILIFTEALALYGLIVGFGRGFLRNNVKGIVLEKEMDVKNVEDSTAIILDLNGLTFVVFVKEVCGWIPDFLEGEGSVHIQGQLSYWVEIYEDEYLYEKIPDIFQSEEFPNRDNVDVKNIGMDKFEESDTPVYPPGFTSHSECANRVNKEAQSQPATTAAERSTPVLLPPRIDLSKMENVEMEGEVKSNPSRLVSNSFVKNESQTS